MTKKLIAKVPAGMRKVFDLGVKYNHNFVANGTIVHNCTEKGAQRFFEASKPKSIVDIAALTSIYRPGPLAADVDKIYNDAKADPDSVVYEHQNLKDVLESTAGTIIFQEQIMLIAERVAGLPPDECDSFRRTLTKRSMVKKDSAMAEFDALKSSFVEGCINHSGLTEEKSVELFEKLRFFSGYGFNKSLRDTVEVPTYTRDGQFITTKKIHAVEAGAFVRTRSEQANKDDYVRVIANHDHGKLLLFKLTLDSGQTIECTLDHKFRVHDGRMLPAWQIMKENLDINVGSAAST